MGFFQGGSYIGHAGYYLGHAAFVLDPLNRPFLEGCRLAQQWAFYLERAEASVQHSYDVRDSALLVWPGGIFPKKADFVQVVQDFGLNALASALQQPPIQAFTVKRENRPIPA